MKQLSLKQKGYIIIAEILIAWAVFLFLESVHDAITFTEQGKGYYFDNPGIPYFGDLWHFLKLLMYPALLWMGYKTCQTIAIWERRIIGIIAGLLVVERVLLFDWFLRFWRI